MVLDRTGKPDRKVYPDFLLNFFFSFYFFKAKTLTNLKNTNKQKEIFERLIKELSQMTRTGHENQVVFIFTQSG